jgi:hypothetical protein
MGADHTAGNSIGDHSLGGTNKDGQVELSRNLQIVMTVFDSLGMCIFSGICCEDPEALGHLVDMAAAKFGGDWDVNRLMGLGVQSLTLGLRSRRTQRHEFVGFGHRQRLEQDLIEDRKHRRRRADAKCEHRHDDEGETGAPRELAESIFQIVHCPSWRVGYS